MGFEHAAEIFGFNFNNRPFKVETVMPEGYNGKKHNSFYSLYRFLHLKKLAAVADVCISASNFVDFGHPAHYFINCINFGDLGFLNYAYHRNTPFVKGLCHSFANHTMKPLCGGRSRRNIIGDPREHVYPNSEFIYRLMRNYYPPFNGRVFYPPTLFEPGDAVSERDPLKIVYLGRLSFEKGLYDIADIVQRARTISGLDLRLSLAGFSMSSAVSEDSLGFHVAGKDWIDFPGELYGKDKADFLLSGTYAVHAMRKEAFGISITEYLKAGLIPIVPDEGGTCEVVDNRELTFHTNEEAANILVKLLDDPEFREEQRRLCAERAKIFSREAYLTRQRGILKKIIGF